MNTSNRGGRVEGNLDDARKLMCVDNVADWVVPTALVMGLFLGAALSVLLIWLRVETRRRREQADPTLGSVAEALLETMPTPAVVFGPALRQVFHNGAFEHESSVARKILDQEWFQRGLMTALVDGERTFRAASFEAPEEVHILPLPGPLVVALIADEADRFATEAMRRDFIANASHELNTPVAAISLLAEAIESSVPDGGPTKRFVTSLLSETSRLSALTRDIVLLSQAQDHGDVWESETVDLYALTKCVLDEHDQLANGVGVSLAISTSPPDEPALVRGSTKALDIAIGNLVENAIGHSPLGGHVGIGVRVEDDRICVSVTDNGPGIAKADQEKIFHRFWRADVARTRKVGGTGLGLSIARNTAQRLGGELTVWSKIGVGSTFVLSLPKLGEPSLVQDENEGSVEAGTVDSLSEVDMEI